jgi:MFS family permease
VIQLSLHASGTDVAWVTDAFVLPTVALELTFGVLGDLFGRKRLLVFGSFVMTIGTGLTALTHSLVPACLVWSDADRPSAGRPGADRVRLRGLVAATRIGR